MSARPRSVGVALLASVAGLLACTGSCLFGPLCDGDAFVSACDTERSYQTCGYNEWTGNHHLHTVSCHPTEACLLGAQDRPTCAIGPPAQTCGVHGARRCQGADVHGCDRLRRRTASGEMLWRHEETCGPLSRCVQRGDRAGCVPEPVEACDADGPVQRCRGHRPQACVALAGPPEAPPNHHWVDVLWPCGDQEVCTDASDQVYCLAAPAEPCPGQEQQIRCVGGRRQRCLVGGGGISGPATPHWVWASGPCGD